MDITYLLIGCFIFFSPRTSAQDGDWELVWEDNFDFLDSTKWDYEVTAWGGGVSIILYQGHFFLLDKEKQRTKSIMTYSFVSRRAISLYLNHLN